MAKIKVSVILPTYNEAGNIIKLIEELRVLLKSQTIYFEIVVIDDDSPDKTGLLAQKYFSNFPEIRVIIRTKKRGLATAIREGIDKAVGETLVVMDTDFNHDPKVVLKMLKKIKSYDFVIGSRFVKGGGMANKTREVLSSLFNLLIRILLGSPVHDNLSGFFAVSRGVMEKMDLDKVFWGYGDYFIRLIYYAKLNGVSFAEVACYYKDREYGSSKSLFLKMFVDYLKATIRLRFDN